MTSPPTLIIESAFMMQMDGISYFVYEGTRNGRHVKWVALSPWDFQSNTQVVSLYESDEEFQAFSL